MMRWDIMNQYIQKYGYEKYLEIGLQNGECRDKINLPFDKKITVDPDEDSNNPTYLMTSDDFFKQNTETFDIIFIDGLHECNQVYKDIENSLKVLNSSGTIFCHDMLPWNEKVAKVPRESKDWTGDCWKAWFKLLGTRDDLNMFVVNTDCGIGVISKGKQKLKKEFNIPMNQMTWEFYIKNRKEDNINEISLNDFKSLERV